MVTLEQCDFPNGKSLLVAQITIFVIMPPNWRCHSRCCHSLHCETKIPIKNEGEEVAKPPVHERRRR